MDEDINQARGRRVGVRHDTVLVLSDGSEVPVVVTDLSDSGFRLTSEELLEVGEAVRLRARGGDMPAEIRWVDGFAAGGRFLSPPAPRA